jgi:hypothetical protein
MFRSRVLTTFGLAFLLCAGNAWSTEPIPLPSIDYRAKAEIGDGASMISRHSNGKMRIELHMPGMSEPMVTFLDLNAKKGLTVMPQPGGPPIALEADLSDEDGLGVMISRGERVGTAAVGGEPCDLWRIEAIAAEMKDADAIGCITRDGIPLRMEATIDGKREVAFEVTEIERAPQDAKHFTPPAGIKVMQMPPGMAPNQK